MTGVLNVFIVKMPKLTEAVKAICFKISTAVLTLETTKSVSLSHDHMKFLFGRRIKSSISPPETKTEEWHQVFTFLLVLLSIKTIFV